MIKAYSGFQFIKLSVFIILYQSNIELIGSSGQVMSCQVQVESEFSVCHVHVRLYRV